MSKRKDEKRRARAKAKAKARAGSPVEHNRPGYRNPKKANAKALAEARAAAIAKTKRLAESRECGECSACCTVLGIPSIEKPAWERCQHVCEGGGCGIYEQRPSECREWSCFWRLGWGEDSDRPEKLGVVVDLDVAPAFLQIGHGRRDVDKTERVVLFRESVEGAFDAPEVQRHVRNFLRNQTVVAFVDGRKGVKVFGPDKPQGVYLTAESMQEMNDALAARKGMASKPVWRDETRVVVPPELEDQVD